MSEWKEIVARKLAGLKIDGAHEGEIVDELAQYIEDRYEGLRAGGVPEAEARRNALEGLNDNQSLARELRMAWRSKAIEAPPQTGTPLSTAFFDLRMAVRAARNRPGFSFLLAGILALGIAGNAAIFSLFNGLFLKPLPFRDSAQLVDLDERAPRWNLTYTGISNWDFYAWRAGNRTFDGMAFFDSGQVNFSYKGAAQRIRSADVTRDLLDVLALQPALGRNFTPEEDRPGGPKVVLLGYNLWQRQFQGDRNVVGQVVQIYGLPYTVVGVLPREALLPDKCDLWKPLQADSDATNTSWYLGGIGRLRHGVTYQQATADLTRIHKGLIAAGRKTNEITSPVLTPLRVRNLGDYRDVSKVLMAAVTVLLPLRQQPQESLSIALRASGDPELLVAPARLVVEGLDHDLPVFSMRTMAESVRRSLWARRAYSWLFGAFALLALLLAAAGIYGVISYAVAQRTAEVGIRIALGASPSEVLGGVLRSGMSVVAAGAAAGAAAAFAAAGLLGKLLFGVSPHDPAIYAAMLLGVALVGLLANLLPARRAATIDPIRALRSE